MSSDLVVSAHGELEALFGPLKTMGDAQAEILAKIPVMTDEELDAAHVYATAIEGMGFVIRGAIAAEIQRRGRLSGGRGQSDVKGEGVTKRLARAAKNMGVSVTTLREDAVIVKAFPETPTPTVGVYPRSVLLEAAKTEQTPEQVVTARKSKPTEEMLLKTHMKASLTFLKALEDGDCAPGGYKDNFGGKSISDARDKWIDSLEEWR